MKRKIKNLNKFFSGHCRHHSSIIYLDFEDCFLTSGALVSISSSRSVWVGLTWNKVQYPWWCREMFPSTKVWLSDVLLIASVQQWMRVREERSEIHYSLYLLVCYCSCSFTWHVRSQRYMFPKQMLCKKESDVWFSLREELDLRSIVSEIPQGSWHWVFLFLCCTHWLFLCIRGYSYVWFSGKRGLIEKGPGTTSNMNEYAILTCVLRLVQLWQCDVMCWVLEVPILNF